MAAAASAVSTTHRMIDPCCVLQYKDSEESIRKTPFRSVGDFIRPPQYFGWAGCSDSAVLVYIGYFGEARALITEADVVEAAKPQSMSA